MLDSVACVTTSKIFQNVFDRGVAQLIERLGSVKVLRNQNPKLPARKSELTVEH